MKVGSEAQNHVSCAASLLARLNLQRQQLQFCDCVIRQGQGQVYTVHRCILAASSPVLASFLSHTGVLVELEEPCLSDSILELLIDFIYTGAVPYLNNIQYSSLLAAAQYLEMDELKSALRTKGDVMEYHNTSGVSEATTSPKFTLSPESHSTCSTVNRFNQLTDNAELSNGHQMNSHRTDLSPDAESEYRADLVSSRSDMSGLGDALMRTSYITLNYCCIPENDLTSHNFIQNINGSVETQQVSIVCQESGKDQSAGAIKQDAWHESKEELCGIIEHGSHSSCSTEEKKNEFLRAEKTPNLCLQSYVNNEEMPSNSRKVKNQGSVCCFTLSPPPRCSVVPVICHSSSAARIPDTGSCTADKSPSERTYCNSIVEDRIKDRYKQLDSERSNNMYNSSFYSEDSNCQVQFELDHNGKDFLQMQDMSRVTSPKHRPQSQVQKVTPPTKGKSNTRIKFTNKRICGKRKRKEEDRHKCSKSTKNACHCNHYVSKTESHKNYTEADNSTTSSVIGKQDTIIEYKNKSNSKTSKLCRSFSLPPEGDTCQPTVSDTEQSYRGHLYYHCHSQPGTDKPSHIQFSPNLHFTPDLRLNYSDESSENKDAPLFGILSQKKQHSAAPDKEKVVLLDISTKSAEMVVSYKHTSEMERTHVAGFSDENLMKNVFLSLDKAESKIRANEEYQDSKVRHKEEGKIHTSTLTSCTSVCGKDRVHDSMSSSLSGHISPVSGMQTNISEHLSSPGHHAFQCLLCERCFSQRGSLNRHVRSHLGVRPFPCPQCPMTFSRQYRVTEHMRVHQRSALGNDFAKPPVSSV